MPEPLSELINGCGLPRAAVTEVGDCPTLLIQIIAAVTAGGGYVAAVGCDDFYWAAVADAGGDLSKLSVINLPEAHAGQSDLPTSASRGTASLGADSLGTVSRSVNRPDPLGAEPLDPLSVVGVLCEGMDLVIYRATSAAPVSPSRARPVAGKLRASGCALLVCGVHWPGVSLHIDAALTNFHGLGRGTGRIRGLTLSMRVQGRKQPPHDGQWFLGTGRWSQPAECTRPGKPVGAAEPVPVVSAGAEEVAG